MATIHLEEVSELKTKDNKAMTYVKGRFENPDFPLVVQLKALINLPNLTA